MIRYISPFLLDRGLFFLPRSVTRLILTVAYTGTYATDILTANVIGVKDELVVTGPSDAVPAGRKVDIAAITDGQVIHNGLASFWELLDDNAQRVLAAGDLDTPKSLVSGNVFILSTFSITYPGIVMP